MTFAQTTSAPPTPFKIRRAALRKSVRRGIRTHLLRHQQNTDFPRHIQVVVAPYGAGKTRQVLGMADAEDFPVLMAFYTRELRDRTYRWLQKLYPLKKAIKLDSPLEDLGRLHPDFNEKEFFFYAGQDKTGDHFSKILRSFLEATTIEFDDDGTPESDRVDVVMRSYHRLARKFRKQLQRFFGGDYDIVFMSQQGLLMRILYGENFEIPSHINVIFDELEVGLWTDGENSPSFINKAFDVLRAGGAWTILTGDLRPLLRMPNEFRVVNLTRKQFISPITLRTAMPLGVGRSIHRPFGVKTEYDMKRYERLVAKCNHLNREISLPLIVAEERARANQDGKELLVVGNVGQAEYAYLGIRTFESLKGDNSIWKSPLAYRIVVLATCPPPAVLRQNSILFGTMEHDSFAKKPKRYSKKRRSRRIQYKLRKTSTPDGLRKHDAREDAKYDSELEAYQRRRREQNMLLEADLVDKIAQIIARARGFRDRPDCDVVVYHWGNVPEINLKGRLPYVWIDEPDTPDSLVGRIYNRGQELRKGVDEIAARVKELKIGNRLKRRNKKYKHVVKRFRSNLGIVCERITALRR